MECLISKIEDSLVFRLGIKMIGMPNKEGLAADRCKKNGMNTQKIYIFAKLMLPKMKGLF